jgi:HPt (histidine-containing phosphotransfer) domain-containing protein
MQSNSPNLDEIRGLIEAGEYTQAAEALHQLLAV